MADYLTGIGFQLLRRASSPRSEVEGEKMVTRHILDQARRNGDDFAALKTRLDRQERRFDSLEPRLRVSTASLTA